MQTYPSWRYHRTLAPVVVNDPSHELEIANPAEGWADTPAAFLADVKAHEDATDDATLPSWATVGSRDWQPPAEMSDAPAADEAPKPQPAKAPAPAAAPAPRKR